MKAEQILAEQPKTFYYRKLLRRFVKAYQDARESGDFDRVDEWAVEILEQAIPPQPGDTKE